VRPFKSYGPVSWPIFAVFGLIFVFLLGSIALNLLAYAYYRIGVAPGALFTVLLATLVGSFINIPVARFEHEGEMYKERYVDFFGMRYLIPVPIQPQVTTIAINVGGALVPISLSVYLVAKDHLWFLALIGVAVVSFVVHLVARPVAGLGIAVPTFVPAIVAVLTAYLLTATFVPALAYVSGVLGVLIGADLTNLRKVRSLGAPMVSIGGAGTFDGIFLTGILAVLLAVL
jgi:uncharacterized membrane protein